eukprot:15148251-Alexandrium_andersonii.AAC.1
MAKDSDLSAAFVSWPAAKLFLWKLHLAWSRASQFAPSETTQGQMISESSRGHRAPVVCCRGSLRNSPRGDGVWH